MKRIFFIVALLSVALALSAQGLLSENKQPPRSVFMSFRSWESALTGNWENSPNFANLDGEWFYRAGGDAVASSEIDAPLTGFAKIMLPAAYELAVGEGVTFAEKAYPFLTKTPESPFAVPANTTSVLFARDFTIPFDYTDRKVYFNIGAADAALTLFVNGNEVGYSTDSRNPAEFEISPYMVRGRNRVVIRVDRLVEGKLLEDQTSWRLSGLNRSIYLFAQPKIRMEDFTIRTSLDPTYQNGLLETAMILKSELVNSHPIKVLYDLYDPEGNLVNQSSRELVTSWRGTDTVRFTATILNVRKWNSEKPELYTVQYRILRDTRYTEYIAFKVGFRSVEIGGGNLLINGVAEKIRGVNLSEFSPAAGSYVSPEEMERKLRAIKLAGFNAVRTDGYPLPNHFYDITDSVGLYVWDVANVNSQGISTSTAKGKSIANDPLWVDQYLYRVNNTYERNKSHSSVLVWELGDMAGNGYNMYEAYLMLRAKEKYRPIAYNGAGLEFNTDIYCPSMPDYDAVEKMRSRMDGQPIIFSRMKWDDAVWTKYQGGFVERWESPSLTVGGKFSRLDDNYRLSTIPNGTVELYSAQRDLAAIRAKYEPLRVRAVDVRKGIFEFENNMRYTNLASFPVTFSIMRRGVVQRQIRLNVDAAPGQTTQVELPRGEFIDKVKEFFNRGDEVVVTVGGINEYKFQ